MCLVLDWLAAGLGILFVVVVVFFLFSILLNVFHMRPDTQVDAIYEPEWLKPHRSEHVHTRQERDRDREIEREIKRKPSTIGRN